MTIKWGITKEQWFREADISGVKGNLILNRIGESMAARSSDLPGEAMLTLKAGRYEVRIDAVAYERSETISLLIRGLEASATAVLKGSVVDQNGRPIQGAKVAIEQFPELPAIETATNGWFTIDQVPKAYGEEIRVVVTREGYKPNPFKQDVILGGTPPEFKLMREK